MADETPDVTIVGAGMAGMTAALKLLDAGFSVKVIEAGLGVGGKFGARRAKHGYHDFAWHVFAEWCRNFWAIADRIGLSQTQHFVERPTLTLLRPRRAVPGASRWPRSASVSYVGSPEFFWDNVNSGLAHWSDLVLFTHSLFVLLRDQDLEREEFLNRIAVNGYMRSLPHMSDVGALLHNELLLRVWAIPSYLISARAYQTYLQLITAVPYPASPVVVLKTNFEEGFWRPFVATLEAFGPKFRLELGTRLAAVRLASDPRRVDDILVTRPGEAAPRAEKVRRLVIAIPPDRLFDVLNHSESRRLRERVPELLDVGNLGTQQTAALTLAFKRRLPIAGVGDEPVTLIDDLEAIYAPDTLAARNGLASTYGISFIDVGQLWGGGETTVLSVLASDAESLRGLDDDEACRRVLAELKRFVAFDDGDIDWNASHFQSHRDEKLFVNAVGSWEYRPEVRLTNSSGVALGNQIWRKIDNLYLAGDYCRSQIDIVSLEGAIHTGIWAAHALSSAEVGQSAVGVVAPPLPPQDWDRKRVDETLALLERWAGLAAQRSKRVAADLRAGPGRAGQRDDMRPARSRRVASSSVDRESDDGGRAMGEALSTYPGFAGPIPTDSSAWVDARHRSSVQAVTLRSGAVVPVPMLFWEAQALVLHGVADAGAVDWILRDYRLRSQQVNPANLFEPKSGSGKTWVQVWAPHYEGTTVGPIKAVLAWVAVEPPRGSDPDRAQLPHVWWWWYYGDSVINDEFKRDVWGVPAQLAVIETAYLSETKTVRLVENGRIALRLRCRLTGRGRRWAIVNGEAADSEGFAESGFEARLRKYSEKLSRGEGKPARSVSVAHRTHDDGTNEVELVGARLLGSRADGMIPFSADTDECYLGRDTAVRAHLEEVGFEKLAWDFYSHYSGVVKIYDAWGSGRP